MVLISALGTGAREPERVWSARSVFVAVVVETPQEPSVPPSSCCHWTTPRTTVLVSLPFSTGAGAGSGRASSALLSRCLLGNDRCLLLFHLFDRHHHRIRLVVVNRHGRGYQFHVGDLVVVARRPLSASSPRRRRAGGVIVARRSLLQQGLTCLKHRGKHRSCVVVV